MSESWDIQLIQVDTSSVTRDIQLIQVDTSSVLRDIQFVQVDTLSVSWDIQYQPTGIVYSQAGNLSKTPDI